MLLFPSNRCTGLLANLKNLRVIPPSTDFTEIDVSKSLLTPGRFHYPKVAKKSKLDELLTRRTHLKAIEERIFAAKKVSFDYLNLFRIRMSKMLTNYWFLGG